MKWLWHAKDGGKESKVWCYGLEIKSLFSILLLRFEDGSREAYHSHAFNCLNWVLKGKLIEHRIYLDEMSDFFIYKKSIIPFIIKRKHMHKVSSKGRTWVLTFRGPWRDTWREYLPGEDRFITLTHGRKEL